MSAVCQRGGPDRSGQAPPRPRHETTRARKRPQVLRRSGTPRESKYASGILPLVSNQHFLLVTLLLCNAVAMEALPLFLDRLADPVTAIVISVTAVLVFGEIFPQALCSRCGGGRGEAPRGCYARARPGCGSARLGPHVPSR
jgi:hypothetical protein